ncbi:MAG TPA: Fic/DOC family N-terminal domain-containing protein, partial [Thermoleophilaceae bacterium]|nr:Fic/DOC family N-terminal domain-containing protein [Thermoleophilaceae bacterium]
MNVRRPSLKQLPISLMDDRGGCVDLERYSSTSFGAARRTVGRHGYVAYFPAPIPRSIELPAGTIRLLADAEAALGTLSGVGQLVPNPYLLIRPYLLREALSSTRIEGTQASLFDVLEIEATGETPNADVEEVLNYIEALEWGLAQIERLPLGVRLIREMHRRLMDGVRGRERTPGEFRTSQNRVGAGDSTVETARGGGAGGQSQVTGRCSADTLSLEGPG